MVKLATAFQIARTFGARDGYLRLDYELQRGSGLMSRRMASAGGWDRWELKHIASRVSPADFLGLRRQGGRPFFFRDCRSLAVEIKQILGARGEESLLAEADRILEGNLPFFGRLSFVCGFPPRWFENPITGQHVSPDRPWTRMRFASDDYGDLKFILEPSRFLFVYPLVRAYAVSADERFAQAFWTAIEDWAAQSPPMSGPLWICGQESSLRIVAWSFALYAFLDSPATTPKRAALLLSMIAAHSWRTLQTVSYARSQRSNHLFSEAVGLFTAGTLYPELNDAALFQGWGARFLREAVLDQITPEGAYLQDSFNYQRMVLNLLLWTLRLAELRGVELDPEIRARTLAAFEFLTRFIDSDSGCVPNHGSNDGSYLFPLSACEYGDYRPLLRLGGCILNRQTALADGPWDEVALWFGAPLAFGTPSCGASSGFGTRLGFCSESANAEGESLAAESLSRKSVSRGSVRESAFTDSSAGYHRIGTKKFWALVRAGHYTRRPFQADQLHVDLWWHGLNLTRDAGTYLYNGPPPWDNGLAGTSVHNTVMVDGRDQMRRAGRFLWLDWAQASGRSFSATGAGYPDSFEGEHDGYNRLGVQHRRRVHCVSEDAWFVVDDLLGNGEHDLRLHWLLPDLPVTVTAASPFCAALAAEKARIRWNIFSSSPGSVAVIRSGKNLAGEMARPGEELLGWESPTYGELRPAISLFYRVQAPLPVRMVTVILAEDGLQLRECEGQLLLSRAASPIHQSPTHESPSYQVSLEPTQAGSAGI